MASQKHALAAAAVLLLVFTSQSDGIKGGQEATPHSRPYMASLQMPVGESWKHECGGFLVADQWVMTAAHCLPTGANGRRVVLGAHLLSQEEDTKQTFNILQVYNHPDYSTSNYNNDIALIKLERPAVASDAVAPIKYLRAGGTNPATGADVDTAGWGSINNLAGRTDHLKELFIKIVHPRLCARGDYYGDKFTSNMMCAYKRCPDPCHEPHRTQDTCEGDSGGPLLYLGVAVGITSNGGQKCGQVTKPGIYTIISRYTQWIDNTLAL